jgi:hypothetical protein
MAVLYLSNDRLVINDCGNEELRLVDLKKGNSSDPLDRKTSDGMITIRGPYTNDTFHTMPEVCAFIRSTGK